MEAFIPVLLLLNFVVYAGSAIAADKRASHERPNILVILSDDQGYADVGFQGSKEIPTPHLDRLAREGVRCTNGYVTHPYCSPSRAGLLAGRYQLRFGHERNPYYDPADHQEGLPLTERLLPEFLAKAGYATGWIGKWHLGAAPEFWPERRGFQETFGFVGGGHSYLNWKPNLAVEYNVPICRNGQPVEVTGHLTLAFGHEASAFIRRHTGGPWFLYLAFNAPHTPHQPTPERLERFAHIENKHRRAYDAQVSLLDDAVGEALNALIETGQKGRTLVFFFSDNGGPTYDGAMKLVRRTQEVSIQGGRYTVLPLDSPSEELFNLGTDVRESRNLAAECATELKQLNAAMDEWNKLGAPLAFSGIRGREAPGGQARGNQKLSPRPGAANPPK